jgi:hypothetical protein
MAAYCVPPPRSRPEPAAGWRPVQCRERSSTQAGGDLDPLQLIAPDAQSQHGRIQKRPSGQKDSVPTGDRKSVSSSTPVQMKHSPTTVAGTVQLSHTMSRESQRGGLAGFRDTHLPPPTARHRRNRTGIYVQVFTHRATQWEPVGVQDSPPTAAGACGAQKYSKH